MFRLLFLVWLVVTGVGVIVAIVRWRRGVERERVIERQVLVMRCPYCAALTPVDVKTCQSCGANK
jgi:hypothetical protein